MLKNTFSIVICLAIVGLLMPGCSSRASTPVAPSDSPADIVADASNRVLLGAWTMDFDAESMTASVMPDRSLLTHYQVKYLIPTPHVVINTIYPNYVVDADVTLTNPYLFGVYDVRLIIYTDDDGHMLENADDWTGLDWTV
ncbi:hypothetical protein J7L05_07485 [bacterium]|nr:hypothetical protein [bacterium]